MRMAIWGKGDELQKYFASRTGRRYRSSLENVQEMLKIAKAVKAKRKQIDDGNAQFERLVKAGVMKG